MEFPVVLEGQTVGNCCLEDLGLYWSVQCSCVVCSELVERLYCGTKRLGVLEREGDRLVLRRRVSKASMPELPPVNGVFSLRPSELPQPWEGRILDQRLSGFLVGEEVIIPYEPDKPCPCPPLFCFFEIRDGFWRIQKDLDGICRPG